MSTRIDGAGFGEKLYNSLPKMYRDIDEDNRLFLQRYLWALSDGGFQLVAEENNGILDIVDPARAVEEALPVLSAQYGFELFNGIPVQYARKLVELLGDLYAKKGTVEVLTYLASIIAGANVYVRANGGLEEMRLNHTHTNADFVLLGNEWDRRFSQELVVELDWDAPESSRDVPDIDVMRKIIKNFTPFYIDTSIVYSYIYIEPGILKGDDGYLKDFLSETTVETPSLRTDDYIETTVVLDPVDEVLGVRTTQLLNSAHLNDTFRLGYAQLSIYCYEEQFEDVHSLDAESRLIRNYEFEKDIVSFSVLSESQQVLNTEYHKDSMSFGILDEAPSVEEEKSAGDYTGFILGKSYSRINTFRLVPPDTYDVITYKDGTVRYGYPVFGDYLIPA